MTKEEPKISNLEKKSIRLFKGDAAFIDDLFPQLGHNRIIRQLVANFRKRIENKVNAKEIMNEFGNIEGDFTIDEPTSGGASGEPGPVIPTGPTDAE